METSSPPAKRCRVVGLGSEASDGALVAAAAAPDATHDPTAPEHVIGNVWPEICKFVVLIDCVRIAGTCRSLKEVIMVDGKIATRRFRCFPREGTDGGDSSEKLKDEPDAPLNFMPQALRVIHFPTLQELSIATSAKFFDLVTRINDFHTATFPLIAEHISEAINLEKLEIDASALVKHDVNGQLDFWFHEFAKGLASCRRLKSLNFSAGEQLHSFASHEFIHSLSMIRAITPVIRANRLTSIRVSFHGDAVAHDESAIRDFFQGIVAATTAEDLCLFCAGDYFSQLVHSIKESRSSSKSSTKSSLLKSLYLYFEGDSRETIGGLETLLKFYERESLENIYLCIPSTVWAGVGSAGVLQEFLDCCSKNVSDLYIFFGERKVRDEEFCAAMGDIIASSAMRWKKGSSFRVSGCNISFRDATARRLEDFSHSKNIRFNIDHIDDLVSLRLDM